MDDYDIRCQHAATAQGLDPITEKLTELEIEHGVAQTGGFCMVVTVPRSNGTWGVINDEGSYLAVWYSGNSWNEGGEEGPSMSTRSVDELAQLVTSHVATLQS